MIVTIREISDFTPGKPWTKAGCTPVLIHCGVVVFALVLVLPILICLGAKAVLCLELRWDAFLYHIPFAAQYGRLHIPFILDERLAAAYKGFPPLPFFVQGVLWRLTGSLNATNVVNYIAFLIFLWYVHSALRARFWIVAMIALTSPLVMIHMATTYYDLLSNAFLAIGISGLAVGLLHDRENDVRLLSWVLTGLSISCWCKNFMLPVAFIAFAFLFVRHLGFVWHYRTLHAKRLLCFVCVFWVAGTGHCLRNTVVHHNPLWPVGIASCSRWLPCAIDAQKDLLRQRPPQMTGRPQVELFFRSLLETDNPTSYSNRPRWNIDQGSTTTSTSSGFRMGGFWGIAVVFSLLSMWSLQAILSLKKALWLFVTSLGLLTFVAFIPQSHELRYFLFIPLTWAAIIGTLERRISESHPLLAAMYLLVCLGLFAHMLYVNRLYWLVKRIDYALAVEVWKMDPWWEALEPGVDYCYIDAVDPCGIMLTGPTMHEFRIRRVSDEQQCPSGAVFLKKVKPPTLSEKDQEIIRNSMSLGMEAMYSRKGPGEARPFFQKILQLYPQHYGALWQTAACLEAQGLRKEALSAWKCVLRLALLEGYRDQAFEEARKRIRSLSSSLPST